MKYLQPLWLSRTRSQRCRSSYWRLKCSTRHHTEKHKKAHASINSPFIFSKTVREMNKNLSIYIFPIMLYTLASNTRASLFLFGLWESLVFKMRSRNSQCVWIMSGSIFMFILLLPTASENVLHGWRVWNEPCFSFTCLPEKFHVRNSGSQVRNGQYLTFDPQGEERSSDWPQTRPFNCFTTSLQPPEGFQYTNENTGDFILHNTKVRG